MAIEKTEDGTLIITGEHIDVLRLLALKGALKLECVGLRATRGRSAYSIIKSEFGLRGNKASVLKQFEEICGRLVPSRTE
jgi:hypothetical protein